LLPATADQLPTTADQLRVILYLDDRPTAGVYNTHLIAFISSLIRTHSSL
jgi:hypothetical protein